MIDKGDIVTVKEKKAHELIPFKPGEPLRVVYVSKFKTDKKRILVEALDQSRQCEVFPSHLRQVDMLEVNGELRTMESWASDCGIKVAALKERLKYGWSKNDAVTLAKGKKPAA
jgi:hypothetical protein